MKPLFYITAAWLLYSCGLVKDQRSAAHRTVSQQNSRTAAQWLYSDSSGRYWQYQSDSAFYYHPEEGLYAAGGQLLAMEQRRVNSSGEKHRDRNSYRTEASEATQRVRRTPTKLWLPLSVVLIVLAVYYASYRLYTLRK